MMDLQNGEHRDRKNVKLFDMDVHGNYVFVSVIKGKSHIALNPSRRCLTCGAKWTFCRTGPKNV